MKGLAPGVRDSAQGSSPFPFPQGEKPGREGSPHAGSTLRASQKRWHATMPPAPPTRGLPPPCASPARAIQNQALAQQETFNRQLKTSRLPNPFTQNT
jgi:hypothetical protein